MTIQPGKNGFRFAKSNPYGIDKNTRHSFAAKHALSIYRKNAIYSFIPKNGCSTLRYSIAMENGFITDPKHYRWIHKNVYSFRAEQRELVCADYSFVILRCPYARLVSCYLDKVVGSRHEAWNLVPVFATDEKPETISFRRFIEILSKKGMLRANIHWHPQNEFLIYDQYSDYFALENMKAAIGILDEKIGFKVHDTRHLYKHGQDSFEIVDGVYADTPAHELAALRRAGKAPSVSALLDDQIIQAIQGLYEKDIEMYRKRTGLKLTIED